MSDIVFIILVLVVAIGGLVGVAYLLDKRRKKSNPIGSTLPDLGPIGRILLWIARIIVGFMVLSIIGAFVFRYLPLVWFTASCLALYILNGIIFRVVRLTGK